MENEKAVLFKTKRQLQKYPKNQKKVLELKEKLKQTEEQIESAGGQRITGMPGIKGKITDLSDYIVLQETLRKKIEARQKENVQMDVVLTDIDNDVYAELIKYRYQQELCWAEVADIMGYSESYVKHMDRKALQAFATQKALNNTK